MNAAGYDRIIQGGTVTTASESFVADVGIVQGKIAAVGVALPAEGAEILPAAGLRVLPGGIDVHTHLDMPFGGTTTADDFASGTTAAACGGATTIVDFAIQKPGRTFGEALDEWRGKAEGRSAVDYGFHMIVTDLTGERLREMDAMTAAGVTTFKLFMAYPGVFMSDDSTILRALLRTRENGGMVCLHAENGGAIDVLVRAALAKGQTGPKYHARTRPMIVEAEATRRAVALAEIARAPVYIVHLSAAGALEEVQRARERGLPVYAETCPQYLYLDDSCYERPGFEGAKFVMSPPLRPKGNAERLWRGLADGRLQVVSTDHCSFCFQGRDGKPGKELGLGDFTKIPNGAPGIETRMPLLWDAVARGVLTPERFVEVTATAPARLFGLAPRKGTLAPGADADILILDPRKRHRISAATCRMNVDYNPFEGMEVQGAVRHVFLRGAPIVQDGKFTGNLSRGIFLKRSPLRGPQYPPVEPAPPRPVDARHARRPSPAARAASPVI